MSDLQSIIELISVVVIVISIPGTIYFVLRIAANRGRWEGDQYSQHDIRNMPAGKGITPPPGRRQRSPRKSL